MSIGLLRRPDDSRSSIDLPHIEVTNELTVDIAHIERAYATVGLAYWLAHQGQGGYSGGHGAIRSSGHGRYSVWHEWLAYGMVMVRLGQVMTKLKKKIFWPWSVSLFMGMVANLVWQC